mmetsp:Transcript_15537/g.31695  ORF Transcript_15537/g.31695 Transcript_15537/m.31695 type:complete len:212 (-) Transcript_15537:307-942(-)
MLSTGEGLVGGNRGGLLVDPIAPRPEVRLEVGVVRPKGIVVRHRLRLYHNRVALCPGHSLVPVAGVDTIHRVAVEAVSTHSLNELNESFKVSLATGGGSLIPGIEREEHLDVGFVEIANQLFQAFESSGQAGVHVVLVAIIDANVWVSRPYQHTVHSAVPRRDVLKELVHRVLIRFPVVQELVVHHDLRLHEVSPVSLNCVQVVVGKREGS